MENKNKKYFMTKKIFGLCSSDWFRSQNYFITSFWNVINVGNSFNNSGVNWSLILATYLTILVLIDSKMSHYLIVFLLKLEKFFFISKYWNYKK
jgi:hypothetical protein